jgi:hypothetical protein
VPSVTDFSDTVRFWSAFAAWAGLAVSLFFLLRHSELPCRKSIKAGVSFFASSIIGIVGCVLLKGQFVKAYPFVGNGNDQVSHIEHLLSPVPNADYRQLVASVIYAFEPAASLSVGALESTPDGVRTVDVEIRAIHNGKPTLTAVDILNLPNGRRAGVTVVDAADSKRADIKADAMLLCSDTGFEPEAISKAKRKHIGLISILRQGDKRITAAIEEQIYLRKVTLVGPVNITFDRDKPLSELRYDENSLQYQGGSVTAWIEMKAAQIILLNPGLEKRVTAQFDLRTSMPFSIGGQQVMIHRWSITFQPQTQWLAQTVQFDAKAGIYDYVRGRIRLAPGSNSYTISGINFGKAAPLDYAPETGELGVGLIPGEVDTALVDIQGLAIPAGVKLADLDRLIVPEDLNPRAPLISN